LKIHAEKVKETPVFVFLMIAHQFKVFGEKYIPKCTQCNGSRPKTETGDETLKFRVIVDTVCISIDITDFFWEITCDNGFSTS